MKIKENKEIWKRVEALEWGKDCSYKRIETLLAADPDEGYLIEDFVEQKHNELVEAIHHWEAENENLEIGSDDGFSDVTYHIVGLGLKEWKKAMKNPKLVEKRYNADHGTPQSYEESFVYCFQALPNREEYRKAKMEDELRKMAEHRKQSFAVKIEKDRWHEEGSYELKITHNGYQWQTLGLNMEELCKVRDFVNSFMSLPTTNEVK